MWLLLVINNYWLSSLDFIKISKNKNVLFFDNFVYLNNFKAEVKKPPND
jgi:hypothetical protein